jgi:hypothetical protein
VPGNTSAPTSGEVGALLRSTWTGSPVMPDVARMAKSPRTSLLDPDLRHRVWRAGSGQAPSPMVAAAGAAACLSRRRARRFTRTAHAVSVALTASRGRRQCPPRASEHPNGRPATSAEDLPVTRLWRRKPAPSREARRVGFGWRTVSARPLWASGRGVGCAVGEPPVTPTAHPRSPCTTTLTCLASAGVLVVCNWRAALRGGVGRRRGPRHVKPTSGHRCAGQEQRPRRAQRGSGGINSRAGVAEVCNPRGRS